MKDIRITKLDWLACGNAIRTVNSAFFDLLSPIAEVYGKKAFLYSIKYDFADCIIKDGRMPLLDNQLSKSLQYRYSFSTGNDNELLRKEFIETTGNTKGHPLAIVIKNYVEVYRMQNAKYYSDHTRIYSRNYSYPLNLIRQGDLFGVWETIDMIFDCRQSNTAGWDAVAGKHCILSTLPDKFSRDFMTQSFKPIFGNDVSNYSEGFISRANALLPEKFFTEIILIPETWYRIAEEDPSSLRVRKMRLREYIFCIGWQQQTEQNGSNWDDDELIQHFGTIDTSYDLPLIKHILDIADSRSFILRPIDRHDGHLFEVSKEVFNRFEKTPFRFRQYNVALDYNTPLFFHYEKLSRQTPWGFEMAHSPSLEMILIPPRQEQVRAAIDRIMAAKRLRTFFEKRDLHITNEFYVRKDSKRDFKSIEDLLNGDLTRKMQEIFPHLRKINCSDYPWYFNALLVFDKNYP